MSIMNKMSKPDFLKLLPDREKTPKKLNGLKSKKYEVFTSLLGNFTLIVISDSKGLWPGITKRMPTDAFSDAGMKEAAARAWKLWQGRDPGYCRPHPMSKKAARQMSAMAMREKLIHKKIETTSFGAVI